MPNQIQTKSVPSRSEGTLFLPPEKKKVGDKENYLTDAAIYGKNRTYVRYERKKQRTVKTVLCVGGGGWIRTIEVEDNRFTVCPLWPLGNSSLFTWSWWTDSNPRPADYKSAALPTELHQRFVKSSCLSDSFSIPHAGVFVNRFVRNYCILFFRSIESDTCCRTVSSALDKSG